MNYLVILVENIHTVEPSLLAYEAPRGYITFFSFKHLNFYYIFRGGYSSNLTPNWRRGAPLHLFQELKFLKGAKPGEIRKIRRADFKKVFNHLNQIQKKSNSWCHVQILPNQLTISHMAQQELSFQISTLQKYNNLQQLCYDFIKFIQKEILRNKSSQKKMTTFIKKIIKQEPSIEKLTQLSSQSHKLIFTGSSYQILSSLAKIFFKKQIIAIGLPSEAHQEFKISEKIRKVIVLTNLSGNDLPTLNNSQEWWDHGPKEVSWKHIQGKFTTQRITQLIEEEKIFQHNDLIIYRGHGYIKNKSIYWRLKDKAYQIHDHIMHRYIHLSCLNLSHSKDDLNSLPFKEGILPLGFFLDRDEALLIKDIFKLIKSNRSFRDACQEALWKNKEYQFFSYWFS